MQPTELPRYPYPFGQAAPARTLARAGCVGCLRQVRECAVVALALAVVVGLGLWGLSLVLHAPMLTFVNPIPYLRQYTFVVHHGQTQVSAVVWSPDGKRLASASTEQNTVHIWDASTGRTISSYQAQRGMLIPLAWSPDGARLALADTGHPLVVLDAATGRTVFSSAASGGDRSVAWSPDGRWIAAVNQSFDVQVWDAASGQVLMTLPAGGADAVAWSPNGQDVAATSQDGVVHVWAIPSAQVLLTTSPKTLYDYAEAPSWSPDSQRLAAEVNAQDEVREQIWDVATGHTTFTYAVSKNRSTLLVAAWSPDSRRLAIGGANGGEIGVWNMATGHKLLTYGGHQIAWAFSQRDSQPASRANILALAWSRDGSHIVSLGIEESVQIWDPASAGIQYMYNTNTSVSPFHGGFATNGARAVAWSPDGRQVAIGGDNFAEVWRPA